MHLPLTLSYTVPSALPYIYQGEEYTAMQTCEISLLCLQGRQLAVVLHRVYESLLIFCSDHQNFNGPDADIDGLLKDVWEANCSCRQAGYPESSLEELDKTWGDGSTCSGLPSPMDVPTMSQAAASESAAEVLRALRQLAGRVWPEQSALAVIEGSSGSDRSSYADWEVFQAELLSAPSTDGRSPAASSGCCWGEGLWCFNPACTNLEGPSELALKTRACGGGCGVRYCSPECQAQGWRDGHSFSCGRLRDRRAVCESQHRT